MHWRKMLETGIARVKRTIVMNFFFFLSSSSPCGIDVYLNESVEALPRSSAF